MEKLFERTSTAVSVVTAALLVVSVSYDFGNLSGLSLSFAEVPTTLADHVRAAVLWIPTVGSALVLGSAGGAYLPGGGSLARSRKTTVTHRVVLWTLIVLALILLSQAFFFRTVAEFSLLGVTIAFSLLAYKAVGRLGQERSPASWLAAGAAAIVVCSALAALAGYADSRVVRELAKPGWTVFLKGEALSGQHSVQGLRQFEKVIVLIERSDLIYVIPIDSVVWTSRHATQPSSA